MAVPILRLNVDDNPRIIVKQDTNPVIVTGATYYNFTGSGCTVVTETTSGNIVDVTIFSPCYTGVSLTQFDAYTGATEIILTGMTADILANTQCCTGNTASLLDLWDYTTGFTAYYIPVITGNTADIQQLESDLTGLTSSFNSHTGDTSIHTEYSAITAYVQSQISGFTTGYTFTDSGIAVVTQSGNTVNVYVPADTITGVTWNIITGKPSWLSGTTLQAFQTGHSHSQYLTGFTVTCDMVTGCTDGLYVHNDTFTGYTGVTAPNTFLKLNQSTPQHVTDYPQFDGIDFTLFTGTTTTGIGRLQWGADGKTLEFGLSSDVNLQIGQETVVYVTNKTGSNLLNGQIVYCNGAQGQRPTIDLADCSFALQRPIAMLTEDIDDNHSGWVTVYGLVHDIDTQAYSAGTTIYLSTNGTFTDTPPDAPNARRRVGVVLHQATNPTNGTILFSPTCAYRMTDLSDVNGTPLSVSGQIPVWDNVNQYFDFTANINGYSQTGHTHTIANITGLQSALDGKSGTGHTHTTLTGLTINESQVINLVTDLAGKTDTGTTAVLRSDLNTFSGATYTMYGDTYGVTGFIDSDNIGISYSYSARTVTLTHSSGYIDYYWRGRKHSLTSPWTSTPHSAVTDTNWYLSSTDGINFIWGTGAWIFEDMQVAQVRYQSTSGATFCIRECHSTMDYHTHEDLHQMLGTHLKSGGAVIANSWTANTATDSANSPSFNQAVIDDEDVATTIPQWLKTAGYTIMRVSGSTSVFTMANTVPFLAAGVSYMYINNPITGTILNGIANRFYNVYQILVPVTSDAPSQKYRMIFLLPQAAHTTLALAQAEDTRGLQFGALNALSAEWVIYSRITYSTANAYGNYGKCVIPTGGISYVVGNKSSQVSVAGSSPSNHAILSNLNWDDSGHISSNDYLAAFNSIGAAVSIPKATYSLSGHTHDYVANSTFSTYTGTTVPNTYATILATINQKTGSTYTALTADNGKILEFTNTGATTITLPTGLTTGYQITCVNYSSSVKTFAAGSGATVRSKSSYLKLSTIYNAATAYYRGSNTWVVFGDLTAT